MILRLLPETDDFLTRYGSRHWLYRFQTVNPEAGCLQQDTPSCNHAAYSLSVALLRCRVFQCFALYFDIISCTVKMYCSKWRSKSSSINRPVQVLFSVVMLSACIGCNKKSHKDIAVVVNGYEITKPEILQTADMLRESIVAAHPEKAVEGVTDELMAGAAHQLIANRLLSEEARARGISASRIAVDSAYSQIRQQVPDKAAFERELIKMGETDSSFRTKIGEGITLESLMVKILEGVRQIDSQECRSFYEKNKDTYKESARIRVSQIFLPFPDSISENEKKDVTEKLTEMRRQILAGKKFADYAKKHSRGPGSTEGGDMGWFNKGDLRSDLETPILSLKKEELSPIVTTDIGVHLLKKTDEETEKIQPFETVEKRIRFLLELKERNMLITRHIDSLMSEADIKYIDTTLAKKPLFGAAGILSD